MGLGGTLPNDETVRIAERFMLGDLIKVLIMELKLLQVPWATLPEKEQQKRIDHITDRATEAVKQVVRIVATNNRPYVMGEIDSVLFKEGVKIVMNVSRVAEDRHKIADAQGTMVLLVLPEIDKHLGGEPPKADKDQPGLPLEDAPKDTKAAKKEEKKDDKKKPDDADPL